jgi:hypothetical protein
VGTPAMHTACNMFVPSTMKAGVPEAGEDQICNCHAWNAGCSMLAVQAHSWDSYGLAEGHLQLPGGVPVEELHKQTVPLADKHVIVAVRC